MIISDHAIERFIERTGTKKSKTEIINKLLKMLRGSEEVILDFTDSRNIKKYHTKGTEFKFYNGFLMIIKRNVLVTVYTTNKEKFC